MICPQIPCRIRLQIYLQHLVTLIVLMYISVFFFIVTQKYVTEIVLFMMVLNKVLKKIRVTLYFKVLECNYTNKYWVLLINYM